MTARKTSRADHRARTVVLGASGQLGSELLHTHWGERQLMIGLTRADLDIADRDAVVSILTALRPDLVINSAAYAAVDRAEGEVARAFAINRDGAAHVGEACASLAVPLIHLSTDYVFDGRNERIPYREDDTPAPLSVYGLSKAAGENLVRARHARTVVLRTSWLFGTSGKNFVRTILDLARDRAELRIVADQIGCPTAATDLAVAIRAIGQLMLEERACCGFFHFTGLEPVSWCGFAEAILNEAAPRLPQMPRLVPITTAEYPTPARRPAYSVLDCSKLATRGIKQRSWRPALSTAIKQLIDRHDGNLNRLHHIPRSAPCPTFS
jgi:dTDP-4-dehydrorhamnose reductase